MTVAAQIAKNGWVPFETVVVAGVPLVTASGGELIDAMVADCRNARERDNVPPRLVFDLNGHAVSLRETDARYREAFDQGDILHADGGFLVTLSRWLAGVPIKERSAATDFMEAFAQRAAREGLSFYLLGGTEEVNASCAGILVERYPGLKIAGRRNGFFSRDEEPAIIEAINASRADMVWVGLGKDKEVPFCVAHRDRIRAGWVYTSGGCFNYVTGHYPRAPQWMKRTNTEWIFRMVSNPRLVWRYLVTTPHALALGLLRTPRKQRPGRVP
jgi:exopolysaccharide biosynthesis WecB/TagA/CpsF family protein